MKIFPTRNFKNQEIHTQARNPVIYTILQNDTQDHMSLPINSNSLSFHDKELQNSYFESLYLQENERELSGEFKQNLLYFFTFYTITSLIITASVISIHSMDMMTTTELRFHLLCVSLILIFAFAVLLLVHKSSVGLYQNKLLFLALGIFFTTYLMISHKGSLNSVLKIEKSSFSMNTSLYLCSFIFFFRQVTFDSHKFVLFLSTYCSIFFLIFQFATSTQQISQKFSDYFSITLVLVLNSVESYKISLRSMRIFYRMYQEELKNKVKDDINRTSNAELISGSELVIEKCDKVILEIQNAKRIIFFKDIRERLRSAIKALVSIKKYLGHLGVNDEVISISDTANIDDQDKQFLAQNFLSITRYVPEKHMNRHLTLKDLISQKQRISLSMSALANGAEILESIGFDWNLDIFKLALMLRDPLALIGKHFFYRWDIGEVLHIDRQVFFGLCETIEINYHSENPYHNSKHACCVFNSLMCFIINSKLESMLNPLESIVCMIATMSHDIGHPGVTNRYLVASRNELALRYNDISVLENMHCSLIYELLNNPKYNVFQKLKASEWTYARKMMIELIMFTDMSKHFELLSRFRMRTCSLQDLNEEIPEDRIFILCIALKCADLGHSAKCFEIHEKWTALVSEEFFKQGDLEKENGLPVSMYCDRETTDLNKSQAGFLRNVCLPLLEVFSIYCKSEFIEKFCYEQTLKNLAIWEEKSKESNISAKTKDDRDEFMVKVVLNKKHSL